MIRITIVSDNPAVQHTFEYADDAPEAQFDKVLARARQYVVKRDVKHVQIESREVSLTLVTHNDFGGSLLIGGPKPSRKSWSDMGSGKHKNFGNNAVVAYRWDQDKAQFNIVAYYNRRALNNFWADHEYDAEEKFKLLCDTWGKATPGNLKDEADTAPDFTPWWR